jgi:hydrogenase maturation protein HypF
MTESAVQAMPAAPTVLACGAWLKNAACLLVGNQPRWSAPHGDLSDPAACSALKTSLSLMLKENSATVCAVAHDLHPDFYSTQLALNWQPNGVCPAWACSTTTHTLRR